jgi:hypothetical protein
MTPDIEAAKDELNRIRQQYEPNIHPGDLFRIKAKMRVAAIDQAISALTLLPELQRKAEAIDRIEKIPAFTRCDVVHCDMPNGWTCYDDCQLAKSGGGKFTADFRIKLANGDRLCRACRLRAILSSAKEKP